MGPLLHAQLLCLRLLAPCLLLHPRPPSSRPFVCLSAVSGTMSLKTGEHAGLTSKAQVEEVLRSNFTGVPEDWIPSIADQVLTEQPSPAGEPQHRRCFVCAAAPWDTTCEGVG